MANFISFFILFSALFFLFKRLFFPNRKQKLPPGPPSLPIVGHLHHIKTSLYQALARLSNEYGPVIFLRFGCRSFVAVSSPSAIEECFTKNDIIFANRPKSMATDRLTFNYIGFAWAPYGQFWRIVRRFTVVEFFSTNCLGKSRPIREEEIQSILRSIFKITKMKSEKIDLKHWVSVFTFNVLMRTMADKWAVDEEDSGVEKGKEIMKELREIFFTNVAMNVCDFFPIFRWFGYKGIEQRMINLHNRRNEFLQGLVDKVRINKKSGFVRNKESHRSLIEAFLSHQDQDPEFFTDDLIKSVLLVRFQFFSYLLFSNYKF